MRGWMTWLFLCSTMLPLDGRADAPTATAASTDLVRLAWLAGSWTGSTGEVVEEEHWTSPAGGGLVGMHKDLCQGRMISFEFFRIVPGDSNRVCYLTSPGGAPATTFCAVELSEKRVVFENAQHDFPQRILYWLDPRGRLHARIEGTIGGETRSQEWTWTRRGRR